MDNGGAPYSASIQLTAGRAYNIKIEYFQGTGLSSIKLNWQLPGAHPYKSAVNAARTADVAVVVVGSSPEGEGTDRSSMELDGDQAGLIDAVADANPNTIVVLNNGTPCAMTSWLAKVPCVVEAWFPGEAGGDALASILFGDVNPSGKLPTTLAARREDYPDYGNFPGKNGQVTYAEGIYVGYRHFDKQNIEPLFPFGYGLSYTTFKYGSIAVNKTDFDPNDAITVSLPVTNTGTRAGSEVVELYVHDQNPKIDKPVQELKGFARVDLAPGSTATVTIPLTGRSFAYCDVSGKQWKADAGQYALYVGSSSRDIRSRAIVTLKSDFTEPIPNSGVVEGPSHVGNLAYKMPTMASSVEKQGLEPQNATDGDPSTRWGSAFADPQWISVDLGKITSVSHVRLTWEDAYAKSYSVQVSNNGLNWVDLYSTSTNEGGVNDIKFPTHAARWVRIAMKKRATQYGYSLFEFEVYAK